MNICVYGAASHSIKKEFITEIEKLGETIAIRNDKLIFGGGNTGAMGAAARGVERKNGYILGISPRLFNVDGVLFPRCTEFIYTETMRERKMLLEDNSDAFVICPGGVGTFDEFFELLSLKQIGIIDKPVAIFNLESYYDPLIAMLQNAVDGNFMTKENFNLFKVCNTIDEIFEYFDGFEHKEHQLKDLKDIGNK